MRGPRSKDGLQLEKVSIEDNVFHGIVLPVAGPKRQVVKGDRGRYQRVSELHMMALSILSEIFARADANPCIDGDALDRGKERVERSMFLRTGSVPEFGGGYRRAE